MDTGALVLELLRYQFGELIPTGVRPSPSSSLSEYFLETTHQWSG